MSLMHSFAARLPVSALMLALAPLMLLTACNDTDPLPVFFDLSYQVGCVLPECNGAFHGPQHVVMAVNGEDGVANACDASSANGVTTVTLRSEKGTGTVFEIKGAAVGDPTNVGSQCFVTIIEGANTYGGRCSTATPTTLNPCQLTEFGKNANGLLSGKLYCNNIPNSANPGSSGSTRDIGKAGSFSSTPAPATFLIDPCNGL